MPDEVGADLDDPHEPPDHVGDYETIEDYFRSVLEEFIHPHARWLLDCLDMTKVREHFEDGRNAYHCEQGQVFLTRRQR